MRTDDRSDWLRRLDEECPYQVVLPRGQFGKDDDLMAFLSERIGKFDMYVEDDDAVFIRYCFADPGDAQELRRRFAQRSEWLRLAG